MTTLVLWTHICSTDTLGFWKGQILLNPCVIPCTLLLLTIGEMLQLVTDPGLLVSASRSTCTHTHIHTPITKLSLSLSLNPANFRAAHRRMLQDADILALLSPLPPTRPTLPETSSLAWPIYLLLSPKNGQRFERTLMLTPVPSDSRMVQS